MQYIFIFLVFILLFILLCFIRYQNKYLYIEKFDIDNYKEIMKNNNKEKLYKIMLNKNISINMEDCFQKCNRTDCIQMDNMKRVLDKCLKCNSMKNKCFNKSIIGGNCDDCDNVKYEDKIDCLNIQNFGCTDPYNLDNNNGTFPYYIEIPDNNLNSPFNKKCVFCWNILDNI